MPGDPTLATLQNIATAIRDLTLSVTVVTSNSTSSSSGSGSSPGGAVGSVQFNDSGTFGGYTNAQVTALLSLFTNTTQGVVSGSGGGTTNFLRADGAWAVPPSGGGGGSAPFPPVQRSITAGPVTISSLDQILNFNVAASIGVTLPISTTRAGLPLTIKDVGGNFFTFPQIVNASSGEIIEPPLGGSYVMNVTNQATTFVPFNDGVNTGWFIT